jgi:hypothetical protein
MRDDEQPDETLERFASREFLRREAIVRNEEAARDVNEATAVDAARGMTPGREFACECGEAACMERITMPLDRYIEIHRTENRYVVKPGHEIPDVERVIDGAAGYRVVEKV